MSLARYALAALLVAAGLPAANANADDAAPASIGGVAFNLPVPDGYCRLQESQPADAAMLNFTRKAVAGQNLLLAVDADCGQLKDFETGKRQLLDDFSQVQSPEKMAGQTLTQAPDAAAKDMCDNLKSSGEDLVKSITTEVDDRVEKLAAGLKVNETRFLGVVGQDPQACYAALLEKLSTQVGTEKVIVSVFGMSLLKGKIVYHYIFTNDAGAGTVERALATEKKAMAALWAANP